MTSILNVFSNNETSEPIKKKKITPSLNQGKKFKKYQNKIENSLEKNAEILSGREGFSNKEGTSLTTQTNTLISNNNYTSQQQTIDNLKQQYQNTIQEYQDLVSKISGNLTNYIDRVNPSNPYLNKTIRFTTGHVCYVTSQGVVKWIPSMQIWQSLNIPQNVQINLDIPWLSTYKTPGTEIQTNPPLVAGTFMQLGQSVGNEGSNVFVNEFLPQNTNPTYMGCYATNSDNNNMTFIGGSPPPQSNASIQNGSFSQPVLSNNTFQYITSSSQVPGWYFGGPALLNNSSAWGYPTPYPNGNQCVSLQNTTYINCVLNLVAGATYTISFYSCGRSCCPTPNTSNPVNVQLYTTSNGWIQNIYQYTPPVNTWTQYTATFSVKVTGTYKLFFSGTNTSGDRSSAIQNIVLNSTGASSNGTYSYDACQEAAITSGNRYFALQNINTSTGLGYCAVSNSQPAVTQYGESQVPSKAVALWSSNTANQTGNTATLDGAGSLQVLDSGGTVVFSTPVPDSVQSSADPYIGCYSYGITSYGIPVKKQQGKDWKYTADQCMDLATDQGALYVGYGGGVRGDIIKRCLTFNSLEETKMKGLSKNCKTPNGGNFADSIYATTNANSTGSSFLILQDDGNMVIYTGTGPNDNQGAVWSTQTNGQQQQANPLVTAANSKYGQNWMASGSTLAAGDFIGSSDGKMALVMQSDGNLVLYAYQMDTNCQKMSDGNMGGGVGGNATYDIGKTAISGNMGSMGYVDGDSNLYSYPSTNTQYTNTYPVTISGYDSWGNDIPGAAFGNATLESCQAACTSNPQCAGIVTNAAGNYCWPKTSGMYPYRGAKTANSDRNIYIRGRQPLTPPLGVSYNTNATDSVTWQNYINKGQVGSQYGLPNATSAQKQQLEQLESTMNLLSSQITDLTNKFQGGSIRAENQTQTNNSGIQDYVTNIKNTNNMITAVAGATSGNIQNILKDSDIVVLQKNYDYLFWSILAAGTVLVSMNIVKKQ